MSLDDDISEQIAWWRDNDVDPREAWDGLGLPWTRNVLDFERDLRPAMLRALAAQPVAAPPPVKPFKWGPLPEVWEHRRLSVGKIDAQLRRYSNNRNRSIEKQSSKAAHRAVGIR